MNSFCCRSDERLADDGQSILAIVAIQTALISLLGNLEAIKFTVNSKKMLIPNTLFISLYFRFLFICFPENRSYLFHSKNFNFRRIQQIYSLKFSFTSSRILSINLLNPIFLIYFQERNNSQGRDGTDHHPNKEVVIANKFLQPAGSHPGKHHS